MTDVSPRPRRRLFESAALVAAVALALAVVGFFVLAGGAEENGRSPEELVKALYAAAASGALEALRPLLVVELREEFTRSTIAFPTTPFAPAEGEAVTFIGLQLKLVNDQAGWASVAVTGEFQASGNDLARPIEETIYLRKDGTWLVASQSLFVRAFKTPGAGVPSGTKLGPLDPQRPKAGELAPDFALMDARGPGRVRRLSEFRGQAVVINWYASWCDPCKRELPTLQKASETLAGTVVFLGVDYLEGRERAVGILDRFQVTYPAVLDSDGSVADHYRVGGGLPVTFFVDKEGILRAIHIGELKPDALVENLAKVGVVYSLE